MTIDCDLKRLYQLNHSTHDPWHWIFIGFYVLFTSSSFLCNTLLLLALYCHDKKRRLNKNRLTGQNYLSIRKPKPGELTRDLLISHLAILDLVLSCTMPLSALDGLSKFWPLGANTELLCRVTKSVPSFVVFSSSMIIIVISVNCFRQIICPHKTQVSAANLLYFTPVIITIAILMSTPQFYYTKLFPTYDNLINHTENVVTTRSINNVFPTEIAPTLPPFTISQSQASNLSHLFINEEHEENDTHECEDLDEDGWLHVTFCIEDWPFGKEHLDPISRLYYSSFCFTTQLLIPFLIISISYFSIYRRLQKQSINRQRMLSSRNGEKLRRDNIRCKRRNIQMGVISLVYLVSWFPLGIISILLDAIPDIFGTNTAHISMLFLSCHLLGMSSASANPVIYGYTNKHVRKGIL